MNNHALTARLIPFLAFASLSVVTLFLASCGGDDDSTPTYTVGGTVTGMMGTGLVLQLNAANNLPIDSDSSFTFTSALTSGTSYAVTVFSAPTGQTCRVTNGSGNLTANVSNVGVECRTNADPNGYYTNTGSATVGDSLTTNNIEMNDFQAIVQDNRIMAMSVANKLVYDGPLEMFGDEFTATVSVYRDGEMIYSDVSVSGTYTPDDGMGSPATLSGTLAGTEEGAGDFDLVYATMDLTDADVARLLPTIANQAWTSPLGNSTTNTAFGIDTAGDISGDVGPSDGNFQSCAIFSHLAVAMTPITDSRLYRVTVQLGDCVDASINSFANGGTAGLYTGFATSRTDTATPDDTLVFIVTSANGQYTASGDFK